MKNYLLVLLSTLCILVSPASQAVTVSLSSVFAALEKLLLSPSKKELDDFYMYVINNSPDVKRLFRDIDLEEGIDYFAKFEAYREDRAMAPAYINAMTSMQQMTLDKELKTLAEKQILATFDYHITSGQLTEELLTLMAQTVKNKIQPEHVILLAAKALKENPDLLFLLKSSAFTSKYSYSDFAERVVDAMKVL